MTTTRKARVVAAWQGSQPAGDMAAYWRRSTVTCCCGLAFSEVVARLHHERTGHKLLRVGKAAAA